MTIIRKKILYIYDENFYELKKEYTHINLWPIGLINNKEYFFTNDEKILCNNINNINFDNIILVSIYNEYYNIENHILNKYIYKSLILNVTDLHIISNKIIYKNNSKTITYESININEFNNIYNFLKIYGNFRLINENDESGVFYVNFLGEIIGIRVSTFIGLKNLLDNNNILISFRFLKDVKNNFYSSIINENYQWFLDTIKQPGIIIIGGETGRGKTTFLYNLLDKLINEHLNIISIEDPVEKIIKGVFQREINKNDNYNEILKSVLRHNPDLIVIGEIRDRDGALLCTRSLLTGHSILSTIHLTNWSINNTNSIKENFLKRFKDFGIKKTYLENYIKAFVFLDKNYKVNIIKN